MSLPDGVGATGARCEGASDFATQQGICAQHAGSLPFTSLQQFGDVAAIDAGTICASTSSRLNQMAVNCFTTLYLLTALLFSILEQVSSRNRLTVWRIFRNLCPRLPSYSSWPAIVYSFSWFMSRCLPRFPAHRTRPA